MGNSDAVERKKLEEELRRYGKQCKVDYTKELHGRCTLSQIIKATKKIQGKTGVVPYLHGSHNIINIVAKGELSMEELRVQVQNEKDKEIQKKRKAEKKAEKIRKTKENRLKKLAKEFNDGRPF